MSSLCAEKDTRSRKFFLVHYQRMWYTGIAVCGYDEIGRHARFRFSCSNALGFESPYPYQKGGQMAAFCFSPLQRDRPLRKTACICKKVWQFFLVNGILFFYQYTVVSLRCQSRSYREGAIWNTARNMILWARCRSPRTDIGARKHSVPA